MKPLHVQPWQLEANTVQVARLLPNGIVPFKSVWGAPEKQMYNFKALCMPR